MNNIQLSILLNRYADQLLAAVERIGEQLPDEMSETRLAPLAGVHRKCFPILDELIDILHDMDNDVAKLERFSGEEGTE